MASQFAVLTGLLAGTAIGGALWVAFRDTDDDAPAVAPGASPALAVTPMPSGAQPTLPTPPAPREPNADPIAAQSPGLPTAWDQPAAGSDEAARTAAQLVCDTEINPDFFWETMRSLGFDIGLFAGDYQSAIAALEAFAASRGVALPCTTSGPPVDQFTSDLLQAATAAWEAA